ncbi:hypothetical protein PG985_011674 [Apiospora marii]|uniref:AAA+ ATPase domain-containing protein n=1 Tax=Apiospora marii TaxID=335849 RepID=A0ABR1R276_9PEZI
MESTPIWTSGEDAPERPDSEKAHGYYTPSKNVTWAGLAVTHKLYKTKAHCDNDKDSDSNPEPAVVWSATVHNKEFSNRMGENRPFAIYQSDKPLDMSLVTKGKPASTGSTGILNTLPTVERPQLSWTGRVFEISCKANAWFPKCTTDWTKQEVPAAQYITDDFESLQFEHIYPGRISITSPFLYRRLKALAGYYPSFFEASRHADLENLATTDSAHIRLPLRLPEPSAFLLHRFPDLEAFVQSPEPQNFLDEKERSIYLLEKEHSRHLVEFLKPQYQNLVNPCIKELEQQTPRLSFDILWYVFVPGIDVYLQHETTVQHCVVYNVTPRHPGGNSGKENPEVVAWNLDMWYLNSDGCFVRRRHLSNSIEAFASVKALTELKICPAKIWDAFDKGERREKLLERSKLVFESLQKGHLLAQYHGPLGSPFDDQVGGRTKHYSGTVVIDCKRGAPREMPRPPPGLSDFEVRDYSNLFREYDDIIVNTAAKMSHNVDLMESNRELSSRQIHDMEKQERRERRAAVSRGVIRQANDTTGSIDYDNIFMQFTPIRPRADSKYAKSLTDHQLLLLFPPIWAFALKAKQWLEIGPDGIRELEQSDESIENLVLEEDEMKTIKGLSRRQNSKRETWAADFIKGKGTGQIILLHGPPGVGKTYTVEAIAEYLHRPLLALTIADIGTVETKVELELIKWFTLAEAWNAVLLVDEADIFLERRQNRDLARNGLVSAFLRRMEYFKGLLFLTTNRVGQIDDAFISRVHVAIGYNALSPKDRTKIWEGFFRKLAKERAGKIQISPGAKKWVLEKAMTGEAQLNGRDIRNALQTAITLAEAECEEDLDFDAETMCIIVDKTHFQRVLDITNKFHSYVQSIRREDEKKRAAGRYDRNDYWRNEDQRRLSF